MVSGRASRSGGRDPVASLAIRAGIGLVALLLAGPGCGRHGAGEDAPAAEPGAARVRVERETMLMGTSFRIQVVAGDRRHGLEAIAAAFAEVARVEDLLSEWRETSEISAVNAQAGVRPVTVGSELLAVVERSLWASEATGGAFDVTFASCGRLWSFTDARIPNDRQIDDCLPRVDYRRIEIDPVRSTVFLPDPQTRIGIAGIGKGFGVDRAADVLRARGVDDFVVEGGGDLRIEGSNLDRPWSVGIAHPRRPGRLYASLNLDRGAVVTSGDYQSYFEREGVRYHHILDPRTGRPAGLSVAVTVIAPTAMDADALATGIFVMGPERGIALVETLPETEALVFGPTLDVQVSTGFPVYEPLAGGS